MHWTPVLLISNIEPHSFNFFVYFFLLLVLALKHLKYLPAWAIKEWAIKEFQSSYSRWAIKRWALKELQLSIFSLFVLRLDKVFLVQEKKKNDFERKNPILIKLYNAKTI